MKLLDLICALLFVGSEQAAALSSNPPACRFAPAYSQQDILTNSHSFLWDFMYWEGRFHQNNVGYNTANGMTYDGTLLDPLTGVAKLSGLHPFSAASKESLHIMVLTHAIAGNPLVAHFLSPEKPGDAVDVAYDIMERKLRTYGKFNETYPGFGGFLPWFLSNETDIRPTANWINRVPALDNGELLWAVYGAVEALERSKNPKFHTLANGWRAWLDYTKITAAQVFYNGTGKVCTVASISNQSLPPSALNQSFTCEGTQTLNDPYEGELFTWWLYLFSMRLSPEQKDLWLAKRPQLISTTWHSNTSLGDITVQKGYWSSSHEQWKLLEMPYTDIELVRRIFLNAERVRTCDSFLNKNPGMYASGNNITDENGGILGYISNAGIPSISFIPIQELDVITPYSVFPTVLFNRSIGLAWWKNMIIGKGMQNPYGSTEAERIDGTGISSFISWDSKITTVVAVLGGIGEFVREKMRRDGVYEDFVQITRREYELAFSNGLKGKDVDLCLPDLGVPATKVVQDYESCR